MPSLSTSVSRVLRWSERYTGTDMVYLARSGLWMNLSSVAVSLLSLLLYIVFAHTLPRETYGIYQYFLSAAVILGAFSLTGLSAAVTRSVALGFPGTLMRASRAQLAWGGIPAVLGFGIATYYVVAGNLIFAGAFAVMGVCVPLMSAFNLYASFLLGLKDFRRIALYGFVQQFPYYGLLIACAFLFPNPLALLAVNLGITVLAYFLLYHHTLRRFKPAPAHDPEALTYGKHLSVAGFLGMLAGQVDTLLAFQFLGPAQLAVYAFSTAIPDRLGGLFKFFHVAAFPKFAERSEEEVRRTLPKKLLGLGIVAVIGSGIYTLIVPYVFHLFFPTYLDAIPYSQVYAFALVLIVANVATVALTAQQRIRELYAASVIPPIVGIAFQLIGVVSGGLWGLVLAKVASSVFSSLFISFLVVYRPRNRSGDTPATRA